MPNKQQNKIDLFIDSGAFSAWSQKVEIDIQDYISFIKKYNKYINVYANLDVIGDPVKTLKNQKIMEKAGLNPLPCYHFNDNKLEYLKYYINNYSYIAVGGMSHLTMSKRVAFFDYIFSKYICDSSGIPKVKVHGFGLTSLKLMLRYPWYSVDSTSWVVTGRLGSVYVPKPWSHALDEAWKVNVSSRSPSKNEMGKHISSFSPTQKKQVLEYFEKKGYVLGKSEFKIVKLPYELKKNEKWVGAKKDIKDGRREVEIIVEAGLCNDYRFRDELNIIYFLDLEKAMPKWPWAFKLSGGGQKGFDI